jgi:glycosyltransferase involved in cell wall biosynthesis
MKPEGHQPGADPHATELWLLDQAAIMGGGQRFALRLARHAAHAAHARADVRVVLACPDASELAAAGRAAGVPVMAVELPAVGLGSLVQAPVVVARLARALGQAPSGTVAVANSASAVAWLAAASLLARRVRVVHLLHERDTAARPTARAVLARSGAVVAIGAVGARTYRAALPHTTVRQVNNFVLPEQFATAPAMRSADRPSLGVVARLIPEKGVLELLDELLASPERWSTLQIAGDAQDEAYARRVRARIDEPDLGDRVTLVGPVSDVPEFLDAIDVAVIPSTGTEGQPTVILEALARGRGVLVRAAIHSSDYEGLPVMPYGDRRDIGDALARLPGNPPSRTLVEERFGPDQALDGLLAAARQTPVSR